MFRIKEIVMKKPLKSFEIFTVFDWLQRFEEQQLIFVPVPSILASIAEQLFEHDLVYVVIDVTIALTLATIF